MATHALSGSTLSNEFPHLQLIVSTYIEMMSIIFIQSEFNIKEEAKNLMLDCTSGVHFGEAIFIS